MLGKYHQNQHGAILMAGFGDGNRVGCYFYGDLKKPPYFMYSMHCFSFGEGGTFKLIYKKW